MEREQIIARLCKTLAGGGRTVVCAYLFGSVARDGHTADSDVDVAVLFDPPPEQALLGTVSVLHGKLEDSLARTVDLVVLDDAPPDLVHRVLRDGVLLLERDANKRIAFEVKARNEYFDLKPYLEEYRRGSAR